MYISIVVTLSRNDQLPLVIANLQKQQFGKHRVELIIGVDNRTISLDNILNEVMLLRDWHNIHVFQTGNKAPKKFDMADRRNRIAALRNLTVEYVGGSDFVFSFEDDTLLPDNAMLKLIEDWKSLPHEAGFIEGVQAGRWGHPYIGAWNVDNPKDPREYVSLLPPTGQASKEVELEPIHAGGFYCYLTPTRLYKEVEYRWREPMGPDAYYGLTLASMGYTNYIDWSVICGHQMKQRVIYPDKAVAMRRFNVNGRWKDQVVQ